MYVCDRNNFVIDIAATPGNIHDSVSFNELYDKVTKNYLK